MVSAIKNHAWTIAGPALGKYDPTCLRWEEREVRQPKDGQILVKTHLLSIDPTIRNWLKLDPDWTYLPLQVGDVLFGPAVGEVVESRVEGFTPGDLVSGPVWGWEEYPVVTPEFLERHPRDTEIPVDAYLSIFSHVGRAAAIGMLEVGRVRPGDVVVVSGAAGATGSLAVQIAKANGCRVVGIAGGEQKCRFIVDELGADGAIDYRSADVAAELRALCPDGVDLFFDNVGGPILDAVLANMAVGCRIVICGVMSQYNLENSSEAYGCTNVPLMLYKSARMEAFVVASYFDRYDEFDSVLRRLYAAGALTPRSHVIDGLRNAADALSLLFDGRNDGKLMVKV